MPVQSYSYSEPIARRTPSFRHSGEALSVDEPMDWSEQRAHSYGEAVQVLGPLGRTR